jgi:hypothetical protein
MLTLKVKAISAGFLLAFGYFVITAFIDFLLPFYSIPAAILLPANLWGLAVMGIVFSLWVYAVSMSLHSVYMHLEHGVLRKEKIKGLNKKMKGLDVFMEVAEKEYLKRKISKQTFDDIQRIAGKKRVAIKARKKVLGAESKGDDPDNQDKKDEDKD